MEKELLTVEAGRTEKHYWKDIWRYRELVFFLTWRDILIRYKQTFFGIAWSVLRPLIALIIFSVFSKLADFSTGGMPRPVFVFLGVIIWQLFANTFSETSNSLIGNNSYMISKVYFPRIIFPVSASFVSIIDFIISFLLLCFLMIFYKFKPGSNVMYFPVFLILSYSLAIGLGTLIAAINVKYRDFKYMMPFLLQIGLYISPVSFSSGVIPEKFKLLYELNPFSGIIDGARWALSGSSFTGHRPLLISFIYSFFFIIIGIIYFRKTERTFADII